MSNAVNEEWTAFEALEKPVVRMTQRIALKGWDFTGCVLMCGVDSVCRSISGHSRSRSGHSRMVIYLTRSWSRCTASSICTLLATYQSRSVATASRNAIAKLAYIWLLHEVAELAGKCTFFKRHAFTEKFKCDAWMSGFWKIWCEFEICRQQQAK